MLYLVLLSIAFQGSLENYYLTIDEDYLEALYNDPFSGASYPAVISFSDGESSCMARFRGGTALWCPKKSWAINIDDISLIGCMRLNLDAHYRDLSLTRNCLGLLATELLGQPAPSTSHVKFYINNEYYGVYLKTERVDSYFLNRFGLTEGPIFKALDKIARFAWLPSGLPYDLAYRAVQDSEIYFSELIRFIDEVNISGILPVIDIDMFLSYYATTLAIVDTDAVSKNYYLHRSSDLVWRIFPWDRDATFGNDWNGNFNPDWVDRIQIYNLQHNPLFAELMLEEENRNFFDDQLEELSDILEDEMVEALDSIYLEIREDVYLDDLKQGTNDDFDEAYIELRQFLQERADFIENLYGLHRPAGICSLVVNPTHLTNSDDSFTVSIYTDHPVSYCRLDYCFDLDSIRMIYPDEISGTFRKGWSCIVSAEDMDYFVQLEMMLKPEEAGASPVYFYYPGYGFHGFPDSRCAYPGAVRLGNAVFDPSGISVHSPKIFGNSLWCLPVTSDLQEPLDLSLCVISAGNPRGYVFLPESTIIEPGETLFVTNNFQALNIEIPGRLIAGNCAGENIPGSVFQLQNPSWNPVFEITVPPADTFGLEIPDLVISEINHSSPPDMNAEDWIEFYNPGSGNFELGGFVLSDMQGNLSMIPYDCCIPPYGFFVICRNADRFSITNPSVPGYKYIEALGFNLSEEGDAITLFNRAGDVHLALDFQKENGWPLAEGMVLSLISPSLPVNDPESWMATKSPGTPGNPNYTWNIEGPSVYIESIWPNPVRQNEFSFSFTTAGAPTQVMIFDISGRLISDPVLLNQPSGQASLNLEPETPPGIYFLLIQSGGFNHSRKFVILP